MNGVNLAQLAQAGVARILIANRGEIARRIMRTVQDMGLQAILVYSSADAGQAWLEQADASYCIGEAAVASSYLNIAALLQAAQLSGAQAVHPGYGFLAENPAFAQAVQEAGLVWIGPTPQAMRYLGDKAQAKRLLRDTEVPLLPGYQSEPGVKLELSAWQAKAESLGLPLMIKAAAGGGGRGMRYLPEGSSAAEVALALQAAQAEASLAFGNDELILERALLQPRHIEVQVFADAHGNLVHLGERECSIQRRHQKLIEECPSPAVNDDLRQRLGAAALGVLRAVKAAGAAYLGAGTVEFLLDGDGQFWFMEMNTRLQVEHTVTEEVCGLDLVAWQILVAAGLPLPLTQTEIDQRLRSGGHAIQVRLCAEDPQQGFLPQTGAVGYWHSAPTLRTEHALQAGQVISSHYDSMLAKLIAHGSTREICRERLLQGIRATCLLGLTHNLDFLQACLQHPQFIAGELDTGFVARHQDSLLAVASTAHPLAAICSACALFVLTECASHTAPELQGWSSNAQLEWACSLRWDGKLFHSQWRGLGGRRWQLTLAGQTVAVAVVVELGHLQQGQIALQIDGQRQILSVWRSLGQIGGQIWLHLAGHTWQIQTVQHQGQGSSAQQDGVLRAPLNARVARLLVSAGQTVAKGEVLLVLEAMKMEHAIRAGHAAQVQQLQVSLGQQVRPGQALATLQALS